MMIVAQKNTNPAVIFAINEEQAKQHSEQDWVHEPKSLKALMDSGLTVTDLEVTDADVKKRTVDPVAELEKVKAERFMAIDARTEELIAAGFTYQGKVFSLSLNSQTSVNSMLAEIVDSRAAGKLAEFEVKFFPVTLNTRDDIGSVILTTVAEFLEFSAAASSAVRSRRDSGTVLKSAVRAAATIEDVKKIVDDRE